MGDVIYTAIRAIQSSYDSVLGLHWIGFDSSIYMGVKNQHHRPSCIKGQYWNDAQSLVLGSGSKVYTHTYLGAYLGSFPLIALDINVLHPPCILSSTVSSFSSSFLPCPCCCSPMCFFTRNAVSSTRRIRERCGLIHILWQFSLVL